MKNQTNSNDRQQEIYILMEKLFDEKLENMRCDVSDIKKALFDKDGVLKLMDTVFERQNEVRKTIYGNGIPGLLRDVQVLKDGNTFWKGKWQGMTIVGAAIMSVAALLINAIRLYKSGL